METRIQSEQLAKIAHRLIDEEPELAYIKNSQATIVYLISDQAKKSGKKAVFGECEKVPGKYKWGIPADFTITFFEPNLSAQPTDRQLEILMYHELLHVGIETAKDGTENYYVRPHDLEDFKLIIDRFGTDWSAGMSNQPDE